MLKNVGVAQNSGWRVLITAHDVAEQCSVKEHSNFRGTQHLTDHPSRRQFEFGTFALKHGKISHTNEISL